MFHCVLVTVLLCCVHIATSIRCFECNSVNNSMCLDPTLYDQETLANFLGTTDCRRGVQSVTQDGHYDFFCRKIEQSILHKHSDPEIRVTRGCGWKRHHKACYKADNEDHLETVCQCFTDQCNNASKLRISIFMGLQALVLCVRSLFL